MLPKLLAEKQKNDGLSNRAVAKLTGVSHSTISRALNGEQMDMATLEKLAVFLEVPVSVLADLGAAGATGLGAKIEALVLQEPELAKIFEDAVDMILDGQMSASTFRDLVSYASFRMDQEAKK